MFDWVLVWKLRRVGGEARGESTLGGNSKRVGSRRNRGELCDNF